MLIFAYLDSIFEKISTQSGIADDLIKVVFTWLACIPLGFIHGFLKDHFLRNMYSLLTGLFLSYMCIKDNMYITLATSIGTYILTSMLQKKSPIPVFIMTFTVLVSLHIHRFIYDPMGWKMDGTTSLMLIICKNIYFSTYVADGRTSKIPNLLEYLGYIYFYPSAIIGPAFNFNIYSDFIQLRDHYANIPIKEKTIAVLKHLGLAIANIIGMLTIYPHFPIDIVKADWFVNGNFFIQVLSINLLGVVLRFKYFTAWKLAQTGMNASGITYSGKDFNKIQSMGDRFEIEPNPRLKTEMWNTSVQVWLKDCVYDKVLPKFGQNKGLLITFIISALWHGVHPIYYFTFFHWAIMNDVSKFFYRARSKFSWLKGPLRYIVFWFLGNTAVCYMGIGVVILDWTDALNFYKSMYFIPTFIQVFLYVFFMITQWGSSREKKEVSAVSQKETSSHSKKID
ncbi:hypothetical protein ABPG72_001617 [Tetrahymena utriculariae]